MIVRYRFGQPIETDAVLTKPAAETGEVRRFTVHRPGEPVEHERDRSTEVSNPGEVEGNPLDAGDLTDLLFFTYTMNPDDIVYAESSGKRCVLHFRDRTLPVNLLLRELCDQLPDQFVRTSRFYVVNVLYVQGVGKDGIVFSTGEKLSVPERRIKEVQVEIGSAVTRAIR